MRKVYIYSFEEEEKINKELGYTQKDYDNFKGNFYEHNRYQEQQQFTVDFSSIKKSIYNLFHPKCSECEVKLEKIKELRYAGFRHQVGAAVGTILRWL